MLRKEYEEDREGLERRKRDQVGLKMVWDDMGSWEKLWVGEMRMKTVWRL